MIEDDNRTSLLTQHNLDDNEEQMDALQELYSVKNLEKRERRLSKTNFGLHTSRKTEESASEDFVKMIFQAEEQTVNWDLLALLQQLRSVFVVGVMGRSIDIERFILELTGEKFEVPTDPSDCLQFSRRWKLQEAPSTDCCFIARCSNRKPQWESCINDVVLTTLPHLLVVLEGSNCNAEQLTQLCRSNIQLVRSITKVSQSLLVRTPRSSIDPSTFMASGPNEYRFNLFEEVKVVQLDAQGETSSFLGSEPQDNRQMLQRCLKRNYFSVVSTEPVAHYYLVLSLWTHFKRLTLPTDDLFGRTTIRPLVSSTSSSIDVGAITNIYLQVIEKELRYSYKVRAEEYLKESRDEFFLYQCLKEEKQACLTKLKRYCYFLKAEKTKLYGRLCDFIKDTELEITKRNEQTNYRRNLETAVRCAVTLNYKINKSLYRSVELDQFKHDFELFLEAYRRECIGRSSGYALSQFLKEMVPHIYRYFDVTIKGEIKELVETRHLSVPQEGLHERIVMTEGLLYTLEKDVVDIENRRIAIQKARKKNYKDSNDIKETLRETKEEIHKLRRLVNNEGPRSRRTGAMSPISSTRQERASSKKLKKKTCSLI